MNRSGRVVLTFTFNAMGIYFVFCVQIRGFNVPRKLLTMSANEPNPAFSSFPPCLDGVCLVQLQEDLTFFDSKMATEHEILFSPNNPLDAFSHCPPLH